VSGPNDQAGYGDASARDCAEHGFTPGRCSAEHGFTLVELLVALAIFAMLASAGVLMLGNSVSAQAIVRMRLDDMATLQRIDGLLMADLWQATPRISRTENGLLAPAFFAQPRGDTAPVMQLVRAGRTNIDDSPQSSLEKIEYWVRQGRLERRTYPQVDGARGNPPAILLEGVEAVSLRFRDARGHWLDRWIPTQPDLLPRAVEMVLRRTGAPALTLMFLVGPGPEERKPAGQAING
jgi:general secretion pathway protein J